MRIPLFLIGPLLLLVTLPSQLFAKSDHLYEAGFEQRAQLLTDVVADQYRPPSKKIGDPEKYYWPKVIARFHKYGVEDEWANDIIREFRSRPPFHFTLVGMARIFALFGDAPAMEKYELDILQAVWDRDDSYNSWSAEGTENHISMTRTSAYIYANESAGYPNFPSAEMRVQQMKEWLAYFSKNCYVAGTGEWNSSTYAAYHIISWLNIYDYAKDQDVKDLAKAVLDYYATEMAIHYTNGVISGAEMRGSIDPKPYDATSYLGWLWFGDSGIDPENKGFFKGSQYVQVIHAVTSSYRPPQAIVALAKKQDRKPAFYKISTGDYLQSNPGFVKRFLYMEDDYTLGSASNKYGGYSGASSQLINWKMSARQPERPGNYVITGNGMYMTETDASRRDPYTQYAQHDNVFFQVTRTPENHEEILRKVNGILEDWNKKWYADFKKRFPTDNYRRDIVTKMEYSGIPNSSFVLIPFTAQSEVEKDKVFVRMGTTYAAIHVLGDFNATPRSVDNGERSEGDGEFAQFVSSAKVGAMCGFVLEFGSEEVDGSYEAFKKNVKKKSKLKTQTNDLQIAYTSSRGVDLSFTFRREGEFKEPIVDWGYGTTDQHLIIKSPPYIQPDWPQGNGFGKVPELKVKGKKMNLLGDWPLIQGPDVTLKKGVLKINVNGSKYEVDYRKDHPKFES